MKTQKQVVLVEQLQAPSGSEHTSLLTPNSSHSSSGQFPNRSSRRSSQQQLTPDYVPPEREGNLYVGVHRTSDPQQSHKEFARHFRACNNKFHPCHHNRRVRKAPRDRKDIAFDLLQPQRTHPASPLTCNKTKKGKPHGQRQTPKGQTNNAEGKSHVKAQNTWPPGCPGDVDSKAQSPFISQHSFTIPDGGNQEYIPIKIEDFLSPRSDGGLMSTTTRQLTMLTAIKDRANCLGGWSFLVLALGAVVFLPATLFTGLYLKHTGFKSTGQYRANPLRIIGLSFFSLSILLISIGIGICIVWMRFSSDNRSRPGSPIKAPFQKDMAKESLHTTEPCAEEYELGMGNNVPLTSGIQLATLNSGLAKEHSTPYGTIITCPQPASETPSSSHLKTDNTGYKERGGICISQYE